jgi:hypothetical protein
VLFDVYIAKKDAPNERKVAGTISWFGAFRHHGSTGPYKKTLRFDVTDQLRELGGTANTSGLTVTIEATQGRVAARRPWLRECRPMQPMRSGLRPNCRLAP